jgi:glycosyltransferase involved in cell wall biosynthesis
VECTIRAFARVQARYSDAELTIVGAGSQEDALRRLVHERRLRNVTFAGRVAPGRMHEYYDAADIYVQTPRIDNMPLSVLEAFASGLPAVSTGVGGVPAILTNGVHGLLASDDNDEEVAAHILALLESPRHAQQLAAAGRESCSAYEWTAARNGWLAAYGEASGTAAVASIPPRVSRESA